MQHDQYMGNRVFRRSNIIKTMNNADSDRHADDRMTTLDVSRDCKLFHQSKDMKDMNNSDSDRHADDHATTRDESRDRNLFHQSKDINDSDSGKHATYSMILESRDRNLFHQSKQSMNNSDCDRCSAYIWSKSWVQHTRWPAVASLHEHVMNSNTKLQSGSNLGRRRSLSLSIHEHFMDSDTELNDSNDSQRNRILSRFITSECNSRRRKVQARSYSQINSECSSSCWQSACTHASIQTVFTCTTPAARTYILHALMVLCILTGVSAQTSAVGICPVCVRGNKVSTSARRIELQNVRGMAVSKDQKVSICTCICVCIVYVYVLYMYMYIIRM